MLRHEASATDETDASYLSMTAVEKDCSEWRDWNLSKNYRTYIFI
ncbi:hypothetical protein [Pedobacter aquatilis]|nr:hypothetical protein [Pedobacter aquatilis]